MSSPTPQLGKSGKYGDLKKRLTFLLLALVVFRIGAHIPVPGIDPIRNTTNARSRNVRRFFRSPNLPVLPSCGVAIYALPPFLPSGPGRLASRLSLPSLLTLPWRLSFAPRPPSVSLVSLGSP